MSETTERSLWVEDVVIRDPRFGIKQVRQPQRRRLPQEVDAFCPDCGKMVVRGDGIHPEDPCR